MCIYIYIYIIFTPKQGALLEDEGMIENLEDPDDKKIGESSSVSSDNDSRSNIAQCCPKPSTAGT